MRPREKVDADRKWKLHQEVNIEDVLRLQQQQQQQEPVHEQLSQEQQQHPNHQTLHTGTPTLASHGDAEKHEDAAIVALRGQVEALQVRGSKLSVGAVAGVKYRLVDACA